jgi:hypothetical protein
MPDINLTAVLAATLAAFVTGFGYYAAFGNQLARVSQAGPAAAAHDRTPPWQVALEVVRCLVIAVVVTGLARRADVDTWAGGILLALALWVGFPLVLWAGAILHERTPWKLAAIHAGDWLLKLLVVAVIAATWQ